jgi:hypothetical protein
MSEMVYDTDDGDSTFASHNHVESDIEIFEEAKQQEDETKDEDSSDDDGWTYPKNETYQPYIVLFMSFTHNRTYPATAEFTKEQLLSIKPHHVKRWLNEKAYHTPTPTEQDRPIDPYINVPAVLKRQSKAFLSTTRTSMSRGWKAEAETQQFIRH